MSTHAKARLRAARDHMELCVALLEEAVAGGPPGIIGDAFSELLRARGELAAFEQILTLEERLTEAPPTIRAVR